jgi:hypothetical protein
MIWLLSGCEEELFLPNLRHVFFLKTNSLLLNVATIPIQDDKSELVRGQNYFLNFFEVSTNPA